MVGKGKASVRLYIQSTDTANASVLEFLQWNRLSSYPRGVSPALF